MGRWPGQQATTPSDMTKHSNSHPICSNILESIGNTPMVRINRIAKDEGLLCDVGTLLPFFIAQQLMRPPLPLVVKCEFMNPGGSVKDRIAKKMVEEAELLGRLVMEPSPTVIIEPTSGNTGTGRDPPDSCCLILY
jgi:cystathionine beta-synthase